MPGGAEDPNAATAGPSSTKTRLASGVRRHRRPTPGGLLSAALTGGHRDLAFIVAWWGWLDRLDHGADLPCICGRDFGADDLPASYAMVAPHGEKPRRVAIFGVCAQCDARYGENRALAAAVHEQVVRLIWAGAREIDPAAIMTEAGRA